MAEIVATLKFEGKEYVVHMDWDSDTFEADHALYMWTDGNYGCDCNRLAFISYEHDDGPGEKKGHKYFPDDGFPCGETVELVGLMLDGKDLLRASGAPVTGDMTSDALRGEDFDPRAI